MAIGIIIGMLIGVYLVGALVALFLSVLGNEGGVKLLINVLFWPFIIWRR